MRRPRSLEEYREMIRQALYDVEELRASVEYDEEFMGGTLVLLYPIETGLHQSQQSVSAGTHQFEDQDLSFMPIARQADPTILPFKLQLIQINETHRLGLEGS